MLQLNLLNWSHLCPVPAVTASSDSLWRIRR